ncbi:MAG: hypothetical protein KAR20_02635, partial [Candidatus Heimdallarchaeota archaeon]|nr:hypothetical protein [Candidatus Heimdallarchaeota archaeon]
MCQSLKVLFLFFLISNLVSCSRDNQETVEPIKLSVEQKSDLLANQGASNPLSTENELAGEIFAMP